MRIGNDSKAPTALDVEVCIHAAVVVQDEVARGIAALDVGGVGVVRGEKPRVVLRDQRARRLVRPLHKLPPRIQVEEPLLPPPVEEALWKAAVAPALVDELCDARRRLRADRERNVRERGCWDYSGESRRW